MFLLLIENKSYGWCCSFPLIPVLNLDLMAGAMATILQHEMTNRMKSPYLKDGGDENEKSIAP